MKIAIIEDHTLLAELMAAVCRRDFKFDVVITETLGLKGLAKVRLLKPDLVLLDLSLPDADGLDVAAAILQELPKTRVLAISSLRDPVTLKRVRDLGIHGFVDKREQNVKLLREAIRMVSQGHGYFSPVVSEVTGPLARDPKAYFRILSEYEQRVLTMIGHSLSDEEIAVKLKIRTATAQSRRRDIMAKLGIHSTPKLIRYATEQGFTRIDSFPKPPPGPA
jgi:DNA-binding NarL/FixJ family response regulator